MLHFTFQLALHFLDLNKLGRPSLGDFAAEVAERLTAVERDRIQAEAPADYYRWGIAPAADAETLLAARTLGWLDL